MDAAGRQLDRCRLIGAEWIDLDTGERAGQFYAIALPHCLVVIHNTLSHTSSYDRTAAVRPGSRPACPAYAPCGAGSQPYNMMSMKRLRSESPPPSPPPPALMEVGAPATTTHTAMLVAEAKKECKKGELRRVKAELQDVQRRHEVVERELWQLESQAHAWYAQEAIERMQAHPGVVGVQREGCCKASWVAAYQEGREALKGAGAQAVIEAAMKRFTADAAVQSDGKAALTRMNRTLASRPA